MGALGRLVTRSPRDCNSWITPKLGWFMRNEVARATWSREPSLVSERNTMTEEITRVETVETELPVAPKETKKEPRKKEPGNPCSGRRGIWINLMQPVRAIFFLPAFINVEQARKIVKTGRGKTWGIDDIFYIYPLLAFSLIAALASWLIDSTTLSQILGTAWVLMLGLCLWTMGTDIGSRLVGLIAGLMVTIVTVSVTLQWTGTLEVAGSLRDFVSFFTPEFPTGVALLLNVVLLGPLIQAFLKSRLHETLTTDGNKWIPARLMTEATWDASTHRIYLTTPDWLERVLFGSRDVHVCAIIDAVRSADEIEEKSAFVLPNVWAARIVNDAIQYATSRVEMERR